mgnify:CR=1 FL=1
MGEYSEDFERLGLYDQGVGLVLQHRDALALDAALERYLTVMQKNSQVSTSPLLKVVSGPRIISIPANRRKGQRPSDDDNFFSLNVRAHEDRE